MSSKKHATGRSGHIRTARAADDRRGTLTRRPGPQLDNEVVAELGGAVLLECLGYTKESDRGGCWEYIRSYAEKYERSPLGVITELLERTCAATPPRNA